MLDTLVIGAGPAGLAVAKTLTREGLSVAVLEKGSLADHVAQFPTYMRFFSTRELLEIDGFPLTIPDEKPSRQQYLIYLTRFAHDRGLDVRPYTEVTHVERQAGHFVVRATTRGGQQQTIPARSVVVASGAFEPRRLGVPGEDLPKVTSHFTETHPYIGQRVMVVGGRNSAVETALLLWRAGAHVSLSYRRTSFEGHGLKYWLKPDIENRLKNGEIEGYLGTTVERIEWDAVTLVDESGKRIRVPNDFVLLQIGYNPPVEFLKGLGLELEDGTNRPRHNPETLESTVPGLFIAGTITAGNVSGHVFIENSRHHGELIFKGLRAHLQRVA